MGQKSIKTALIRSIPYLVIAWVAVMLLSLRFGFLNVFSYSAAHYDTQGIDFFSLPKAFLNLLDHRSLYDSWGGAAYGPHSTWFISHPAFGLIVGFWFAFFPPWTSYWLFVLFSLGLFAWSARLLAENTDDPLLRRACYLLIICSFPTYWVLFSGNIQAVSVLSFALILAALFTLAYQTDETKRGTAKIQLLAGLLISFFSKPFALLFVPLLLVNKSTRHTTLAALLIYAVVSVLCLFTPLLNPESIGAGETLRLALHPQFVKDNLNVYKNHFALNSSMKDNSIHWLHLVAQSDYYWNHIDIISLTTFANTLAGRVLPSFIFKLPLLFALLLSLPLAMIRDARKKLELALVLTMALTLTFFLSYHTVWEYQYTLFLPAVALWPLLREKNVFFRRWVPWLLAVSAFFYLPTFYFLFPGREVDAFLLNAVRLNKVVPALLVYLMLITIACLEMSKEIGKKVVKPATKRRG
jgi:hypothetical protein